MARTPLYSKGQSIAFLMVLAALTMGGLGEPLNNPGGRRELFVVPVVAVLYVLAFVIAVSFTYVALLKRRLEPLPRTEFPADDVVGAFRYMQQRKNIGKVIVTMAARDSRL